MTADESRSVSRARRPWWRLLTQFSLRTLLLLVTAASVACWWFLQPQSREEQFEQTPLRVKRQIQLRKIQPMSGPSSTVSQVEIINGTAFEIINAGRWQLFDQRRNLIVDGRYENDQQHGRWTTYHVNGRKAAQGQMHRGEKVGPWRTWDEEGRLLSEVTY